MAVDRFIPVVGFVGASNSGKTTLISAVLPYLREAGLRVAVLKHARHGFDMDLPGKDSYRMREAGAAQVLVASRERWVLQSELAPGQDEPPFRALLGRFDAALVDVVLAEGFASESYPKIEVYRASRGEPPKCWPTDPMIIAVATDAPVEVAAPVRLLNLNAPELVAEFVLTHLTATAALPPIHAA